MTLPNIFTKEVSDKVIQRINSLQSGTNAHWGKMNVGQMLAHCNVTYELVYTDKHKKPNAFIKLILKTMAKNTVVSEKPYKKNGPTGPQFVVADQKNFEEEKSRLIDYIKKTQELGENYFDNKESHSFGVLNKNQWNNMFYKHLDHHLTQFGV